MTDLEFDNLERQVREESPDDKYFTIIGAEVLNDKVKLPIIMGSLNQYRVDQEVQQWWDSYGPTDSTVVTEKLDGLSILIVYSGGQLYRAYTRGDGTYGKDITRHAVLMRNLPQKITTNDTVIVRGEIIIKPTLFESEGISKRFENPRNYVSGRVNSKTINDEFLKFVDVIAYDAHFDTQVNKIDQLAWLDNNGFSTPRYQVFKPNQLVVEVLTEILQSMRASAVYEIDGIVCEFNSHYLRVGMDSHNNPRYAFKFKLNDEANHAETVVVDVHYEVSKHGYLKPRVEIEPVRLEGVTITFVSGINASYIRNSGIGPGARVRMVRAGSVIPYITEIIEAVEPKMPSEDFGETKWSENEVDLILVEDTDSARIKRITGFFTGIDTPHVKEGNVNKLFLSGLTTVDQIIKADLPTLNSILGVGMGQKIFTGIKQSLTDIPIWKLVGSSQMLGRGIGRRRMKAVYDVYPEFLDLTQEQIAAIDGFEEKTASLIVNGLAVVKKFLADIEGYYTLASPAPVVEKIDLSVCFSGVRDSELEARITAMGGKIASDVSKTTTHLVLKDATSTSSKTVKAQKFGTFILSLEDARLKW